VALSPPFNRYDAADFTDHYGTCRCRPNCDERFGGRVICVGIRRECDLVTIGELFGVGWLRWQDDELSERDGTGLRIVLDELIIVPPAVEMLAGIDVAKDAAKRLRLSKSIARVSLTKLSELRSVKRRPRHARIAPEISALISLRRELPPLGLPAGTRGWLGS